MIKIKDFTNLIKRSLFNSSWTCNACGKEIFDGYFCDDCLSEIVKIGDNKCLRCGRQTPYPVPTCDSCMEKSLSVEIIRSVFSYGSPMSFVIQNFKYNNSKFHTDYFSKEMFEVYKRENLSCDIITFVPMSDKKLKKREYNQAELLANSLSKLIGVEVVDCVSKIKETENQANLTFKERVSNLKGAFRVDKKLVKGKSVLLVDDVLTTGSTVGVIGEALKRSGAIKVSVLTIASVSKFKNPQ